jgi:hypothetical protein
MKKQIKTNWQTIAFVAVATVVFLFAASSFALGQDKPAFKPGDRVEVDGTGTGWWSKGTVTKIYISDGTFFGYWVKLDGQDTDRHYGKTPKDIRVLKESDETEKNEQNVEAKPDKETNPPKKDARETQNKNQTGRFKVGDRVKSCPMQMQNCDDYWENCTVVKDYMVTEGADAYQVLCDDPKGGKGTLANVGPKFIRAGAPPPPATPDCPFNEPAGTVSRTSKPSAGLFQRVIYEWYRDNSNGRKVGVTFEKFQLGQSFVNRLTNNGLLHDGAPQGATIYPVKAKYLHCDKYTYSTIRWVIESQLACFKDKFGDWVCPGVPKVLEQIHLPNK